MDNSILTGKIIACAMKVHTTLGFGFPDVNLSKGFGIRVWDTKYPFC